MMVTNCPRLDLQVDILKDEALGLGIAEAHVPQLDLAPDRRVLVQRAVVTRLERVERDVGDPLEMQVEQAEFEQPSRPGWTPCR